jgi:hypothetical protein
MVIQDGDNRVEIDLVDRAPTQLPTPGDVEISIAVRSEKFAGQAFAWIDSRTFSSFLAQLKQLEEQRQGSATMEGMSPSEFHLRIFPVDRRGHLAISGRIRRLIHRGEAGPYCHVLEFGFEFDPTLLPQILREFARSFEAT